MKKVFFTVLLLLAVASLGLALPRSAPPPLIPVPEPSDAPILPTKPPKFSAVPAASPTLIPVPEPSDAPILPTKPPKLSAVPAASPTLLPPPKSPKFPPKPPKSSAPPAALPASLASPEALTNEFKVSPKCGTALFTIVTSPEILKCLPLNAFLPLLPILTDPDFLKKLKADPAGTFKKIEPSFVQFSDIFCAAPECSKDAISSAVQTLSTDCADELKNNQIIQLAFAFFVFYPDIHDTTCFKSKEGKKLYCWDESLTTVFTLPKSPIKITGDPLVDSIAVADPQAVCTVCNKDIVNTFFNFINNNDPAKKILAQFGITDKELGLMKVGVAVKCGISFEDGKIPG